MVWLQILISLMLSAAGVFILVTHHWDATATESLGTRWTYNLFAIGALAIALWLAGQAIGVLGN
ncbi:MAG: hypothetical protein K6U87_15150 [Firmicutes bacterium]|nr:hypothetical protein [Bacillota bacterium]